MNGQSGSRLGVLFASLGSLVFSFEATAQNIPVTEVWLASVQNGFPSQLKKVSDSTGYNNQPMFSEDSHFIYFTSEQDGQTDVTEYSIQSGDLRLVLSSPESEYSPTPIPGQEAVSVIRVEPPDQLQRLWSIAIADGASELLMPNVEPVGYHTWLDEQSVAAFILGESFTMHKAVVGDQPSEFLADNIGRTLRTHSHTGHVLFVDKNSEPWTIASFDTGSGRQTTIMNLFPGVEDFETDTAGRFWMGSGSKMYRSSSTQDSWELAVDLREIGIDNITRLAASPDGKYLAIVAGR